MATTIATINCFSLITSGLWGLLWYRELKGRPAVAWAVAAAFTAAMSVLLSMEKGTALLRRSRSGLWGLVVGLAE